MSTSSKSSTTIKALVQLIMMHKKVGEDLASFLNTSFTKRKGIGPNDAEKHIKYINILATPKYMNISNSFYIYVYTKIVIN